MAGVSTKSFQVLLAGSQKEGVQKVPQAAAIKDVILVCFVFTRGGVLSDENHAG